jgi:hypothetical protein
MIQSADEMLKRCARDGGRIVCSGNLTHFQIAEAQASGNWFVTEDGFGFTILPWDLTTERDRAREYGYFERNTEGKS